MFEKLLLSLFDKGNVIFISFWIRFIRRSVVGLTTLFRSRTLSVGLCSSIEGCKKTSVCVTPHLSLKTPLPFNNKRDYKGDTLDKTLDSRTNDSDV